MTENEPKDGSSVDPTETTGANPTASTEPTPATLTTAAPSEEQNRERAERDSEPGSARGRAGE